MPRPGDRVVLCATCALAIALPTLAHHHIERRVDAEFEPAAERALGVAVDVGAIDVGLTGTLRLSDVSLGHIVSVAGIEASLAPADALRGDMRSAEIRLETPIVRVRVDADGGSNLERLLARARATWAKAPGGERADGDDERDGDGARRLRRVVVTGGALTVQIGGGEIEVRDLTLHPHRDGARVVSGATSFRLVRGPYTIRGAFQRAGGDLALPALRLDRLLAVGGDIEIVGTSARGPHQLRLTDARLGRGVDARSPDHSVHGISPNAKLTNKNNTLSTSGWQGEGAATDPTEDHSAAAPARGVTLRARIPEPGTDPELVVQLDRAPAGTYITARGTAIPLAALSPLLPRGFRLDDARGTGVATLVRRGGGPGDRALDVEVSADVDGLVIDDRRLARHPVALSGRADVAATLASIPDGPDGPDDRGAPDARALTLRRVSLVTGALAVAVTGSLRLRRGHTIPDSGHLAASIPVTDCGRALASLPRPLRAQLDGMQLSGPFSAALRLDFDRADPDATLLDLDVAMSGCRTRAEAADADPRRIARAFEHRFPDGRRGVVGADTPGYVALGELPAHLVNGFVAAEDARFFDHPGFDVHQIERSLAVDLRDGAFARGGSTISQQLVKNLFLSPRRTLARKLQEAVLTWRLEAHASKRLILERYLNIIELGPGVYGVGAAARHWFDKPASELSVAEAAFLIALTPAPRTISRRVAAAGGIDADTRRRVGVILRAMRRAGAIDEGAYKRARQRPAALQRAALARAD